MASIVTDEGLDWYRDKVFNQANDEIPYIVAVGTGTNAPASGDTSLQSQEYQSNDSNSNCTVSTTSNVGEYEFKITVTGGLEVPAGTDITEIGVETDGSHYFLYREKRGKVTVSNGESQTFRGTMKFISG